MTRRVVRRSWCPREVDRSAKTSTTDGGGEPLFLLGALLSLKSSGRAECHSVGVEVTGTVGKRNSASGGRPRIKGPAPMSPPGHLTRYSIFKYPILRS
jgi:hypothetical protein